MITRTLTLQGSNGGTIQGIILDNSATGKVAVTKSGDGTWVLSGPNTYTGATAVSLGKLFINVTSTGVVSDPYTIWAVGGVAFDADTNNDGIANGLAWLLGAASPSANALNKLPIVTHGGGNLTLTFSCLNDSSNGSAVLNVEHSGNLGLSDPWAAVAVPDANSGPVGDVTFTVTPNGNLNNVTATISSTEAASGKLFGRLKANP